jgi:hypothetical protein
MYADPMTDSNVVTLDALKSPASTRPATMKNPISTESTRAAATMESQREESALDAELGAGAVCA